VLRTGGLPLLPEGMRWPECPLTGLPMLFRAQLPLCTTGLVAPDDERLVLVFESHATNPEGYRSHESEVIVVEGHIEPREAPPISAYDVILLTLGSNPEQALALVTRLMDSPTSDGDAFVLPHTLMRAVPSSISVQTIRAIRDVGAQADVIPSPPTTLGWTRGGELVPYDDDVGGPYTTTLPPLHALATNSPRGRMRALLGGGMPGSRDAPHSCCGRTMRTVARLLGDDEPNLSGVSLAPATVYVCTTCGNGALERFGATR